MAMAIIRRTTWGAKAPKTPFTDHKPSRITIHHSGAATSDKFKGHETVRAIQAYHQKPPVRNAAGRRVGGGRGFKDIGYHYVIAPDGSIYEGRPEGVIGAHVKNDNTGNIGICVYGNFMLEQPSSSALDTLVAVVAEISGRRGIPCSRIFNHQQRDRSTSCPGTNLAMIHERIKRAVADARGVARPDDFITLPVGPPVELEDRSAPVEVQPAMPAGGIVAILVIILVFLMLD